MARGMKFPGMGGMGGMDMNAMLKQAQKMQQDVVRAQEEALTLTAESSVGGGVVSAVVDGKNEIVALTIKPEVVNPDDVPMLIDLIISAVNQAQQAVKAKTAQALKKVTGDLNLPGLG
jgi:DNA-binding YbaB/EbfC family protein